MIAIAAVALSELCGAAVVAAAPDLADSDAYTSVGDDARATGDLVTAVIAYRNALAADPGNRRAAAALAELCRDPENDEKDEADAALLAAIARYRAGERAAAAAVLSDIVRRPGAPSAAHFFLGLIALERHDTDTAIRELELARGDPAFGALTRAPLRLARRDGAVAAALVIEPELDTNPRLVPDTPPSGSAIGAPQRDEDLLTIAAVTARPAAWLAVRSAVSWRNQRTLSELDFIAGDLEIAAELARGRQRVMLRYELAGHLLAGDPYLVGNRVAIDYRLERGGVAPVASFALRRRDYQRDAEQPFTGWVAAGDAGAVVSLGGGVELDARAAIRREATADPLFTASVVGARATLRTRPTADVRLTAALTGSYARYDGAEPDGALRRDALFEASADLEVDLGDHVIAVAGARIAHNESTIEDVRYDQVIARCGLIVVWGGL